MKKIFRLAIGFISFTVIIFTSLTGCDNQREMHVDSKMNDMTP